MRSDTVWLVAVAPGVATWVGLVQLELELHRWIRKSLWPVVEAGASQPSVMVVSVVAVARKPLTAASVVMSVVTARMAEGAELR